MGRKGLLKRAAALIMSAAMILSAAVAVGAAVIDQEGGTLQIQKFKTGTSEGIADVQFNYVNVGDFELNDDNVGGFRIENASLKKYLTEAGLEAVAGTTDIYDGKKIQNALEAAIEDETVRAAIEDLATSAFAPTDASGKTDTVNVPIGIYLVVEKSAPEEVVKMSDPFIVSVPILDETNNTWNYNVVAQPKNDYINDEPEPDKEVVDEDGNAITPDASAAIGQTVNFKISSTVPEMAGSLVAFDFIDTLSEGLTFGEVTEVKANNGTVDIKDAAGLYTISRTGQVITISFDPAQVQAEGYTDIAVTYAAVLNEKAIVGVDGNPNAFEVQYTNNPEQNVEADPSTVHTYGFTLQKNDENGTALAGAVFKLYDAQEGGTEVSFYTAVDTATNTVSGEAVTENTASDNGQASFYGLAAGTYYLEETEAPDGYNLLKERVAVTVSADTAADGIDITIVNTKGFTLPATGGTGTIIFTAAGIVIMLGAAIILIRVNKRDKQNHLAKR